MTNCKIHGKKWVAMIYTYIYTYLKEMLINFSLVMISTGIFILQVYLWILTRNERPDSVWKLLRCGE